jgi:hypothetical protein
MKHIQHQLILKQLTRIADILEKLEKNGIGIKQ